MNEYQYYKMKSALEPYIYQIKHILCINVGKFDIIVPKLIKDNFFPEAVLQSRQVEELRPIESVIEKYRESDVLIIQNPTERNNYTKIKYLFTGSLIIFIGENCQVLENLEQKYIPLWRKILRLGNGGALGKHIFIFEKRFELPNIANLNDDIYDGLKQLIIRNNLPIVDKLYWISDYHTRRLGILLDQTKIQKILAISVGDGKIETALSKLLFPNARLYFAGELSANLKHFDCDLLMIIWPNNDRETIIKYFSGKYVLFCADNYLFQKNLFWQITEWGKKIFESKLSSEIPIDKNQTFLDVYQKKEINLIRFHTSKFTFNNCVGKTIESTLKQYTSEISQILSECKDHDFEKFILDIFPNAQMTNIHKVHRGNAYLNHDLLIFGEDLNIENLLQTKFVFCGLLFVGIGKLNDMIHLERIFQDYWEKILDIQVEDNESSKKIIILKNYYQIPKFTNLNLQDERYIWLNKYINEKFIEIRQTFIRYFNVASLARFFWRLSRDEVGKILAINAGNGKYEIALVKLLFPKAQVYLTDIKGYPPHVEELSALDAILRYSDCDLMITCYPHTEAVGYDGILKHFEGKFIMYIGVGQFICDPQYCFTDQLDGWGDKVLKIDLFSYDTEAFIEIYQNKNKSNFS